MEQGHRPAEADDIGHSPTDIVQRHNILASFHLCPSISDYSKGRVLGVWGDAREADDIFDAWCIKLKTFYTFFLPLLTSSEAELLVWYRDEVRLKLTRQDLMSADT